VWAWTDFGLPAKGTKRYGTILIDCEEASAGGRLPDRGVWALGRVGLRTHPGAPKDHMRETGQRLPADGGRAVLPGRPCRSARTAGTFWNNLCKAVGEGSRPASIAGWSGRGPSAATLTDLRAARTTERLRAELAVGTWRSRAAKATADRADQGGVTGSPERLARGRGTSRPAPSPTTSDWLQTTVRTPTPLPVDGWRNDGATGWQNQGPHDSWNASKGPYLHDVSAPKAKVWTTGLFRGDFEAWGYRRSCNTGGKKPHLARAQRGPGLDTPDGAGG